MSYEGIADALKHLGLVPRGGFYPNGKDDVDAATVVLIGNVGSDLWQMFPGPDGSANPLDDWCREVLVPVARTLGADIIFPFDGPPYHPFINWAQRAEGLSRSPIGPLIHPRYGMWHAYRGAMLFSDVLVLPPPLSAYPCTSCMDKPCLTTCPVDAFVMDNYDVPACVRHIKTPTGDDCLDQGCRARRACPVGRDYLYNAEQSSFHMAAFLRSYLRVKS